MNQKLVITIIVILFFLFLTFTSYIVPVKYSVPSSQLQDFYQRGHIVLLCTGSQTTESFWEVLDSYGESEVETEIPKFIDIIGEEPSKYLKRPIYIYMNNKFIIVGNFLDEDRTIFEAIRWEIVGDINREQSLIPYPSKYFNFLEINSGS